jgi:hypothetical protein
LTQGRTVHIIGVHTKADDAPRELIRDHEHPVGLEQNGLATKQINAPETVFGMPDKGKPRRSVVIEMRVVVLFKHAPDYIFIDGYAERFVDLLCYPAAAKSGIALLQFNDSLDEFL